MELDLELDLKLAPCCNFEIQYYEDRLLYIINEQDVKVEQHKIYIPLHIDGIVKFINIKNSNEETLPWEYGICSHGISSESKSINGHFEFSQEPHNSNFRYFNYIINETRSCRLIPNHELDNVFDTQRIENLFIYFNIENVGDRYGIDFKLNDLIRNENDFIEGSICIQTGNYNVQHESICQKSIEYPYF